MFNNNGFVQYTAESTLAELELTLLAGQSSGQSSIQLSGQQLMINDFARAWHDTFDKLLFYASSFDLYTSDY